MARTQTGDGSVARQNVLLDPLLWSLRWLGRQRSSIGIGSRVGNLFSFFNIFFIVYLHFSDLPDMTGEYFVLSVVYSTRKF